MRLNIGCGPLAIDGEIGVDREATSAADVRADLLALPFRDGCAEFVRLDHVLEHLPGRLAVRALLEARRVLKAGGTIRVGVPDFDAMCQLYADAKSLADKALLLRWFYGSQAHQGEYHQSGWDGQTLQDLLKAAGFRVERVFADPRLEGECIAVEGVRPCD